MVAAVRERITITISAGPPSPVPGSPPSYTVRGTVYRTVGGEQQATWVVTRSYGDIEQWSYRANQRLGFALPPLPPLEVATGNLLALEAYLNQCLQTDALWRSADDLAFFELPRVVLDGGVGGGAGAEDEEEDGLTPTYIPDVYDEDGNVSRVGRVGRERKMVDSVHADLALSLLTGFFFKRIDRLPLVLHTADPGPGEGCAGREEGGHHRGRGWGLHAGRALWRHAGRRRGQRRQRAAGHGRGCTFVCGRMREGGRGKGWGRG